MNKTLVLFNLINLFLETDNILQFFKYDVFKKKASEKKTLILSWTHIKSTFICHTHFSLNDNEEDQIKFNAVLQNSKYTLL